MENNIRILNEKNEKENLIALLKDNVLRDIEAKLKQKEGKAKIHVGNRNLHSNKFNLEIHESPSFAGRSYL